MRKTDARKLTHTELTELRNRGVSAVQDGQPANQVANALGVQRSTLFGWLARYRQGGWQALDARKRGGRPPKLTAKMMQWIYDTVTLKDPRQMRFPFALWTSLMVAELIWRQFDIRLSKASVCRLLNHLVSAPRGRSGVLFRRIPKVLRNGSRKHIRRFALWRGNRRRIFSLPTRQECVPTFTRVGHGPFAVRHPSCPRPEPVSAVT